MTAPAMTAERALDVLDAFANDYARDGLIHSAEDMREARAFFAAMVERTTWRPIETAPKDGTDFIGLWDGLAYTMRRQSYYEKFPHQEGGPTYRYGWSAEVWDQHMPCWPTHWMPLPANPEP